MSAEQPAITIRITPWDSKNAYTRLKRAAEILRDNATDSDQRLEYQLWVDNADRNLARVERQLEREQAR
jgi:hypothetical protein